MRSPHSTSFFFNDTATTEIYTLSLHDALPISRTGPGGTGNRQLQDKYDFCQAGNLSIGMAGGNAVGKYQRRGNGPAIEQQQRYASIVEPPHDLDFSIHRRIGHVVLLAEVRIHHPPPANTDAQGILPHH